MKVLSTKTHWHGSIKMTFRKEKKIRLTSSDLSIALGQLSELGMKPLYSGRLINSCYFDTPNMNIFSDSEEGVLPRSKIRVRWYDKTQKFNKEIKISSIEGRFKTSTPQDHFRSKDDVIRSRFFDQIYGYVTPSLIVSYERQYFQLNSLRITADTKISYTDPTALGSISVTDSECVMEIKVPINCDDDYIEKIIPYSTSRFSKYSRGLLCLGK